MTDIAEATLVMSSVVKNVSGMNLLLMIICLFGFLFLYSRKCSNIYVTHNLAASHFVNRVDLHLVDSTLMPNC
jgi:hypothetical protein